SSPQASRPGASTWTRTGALTIAARRSAPGLGAHRPNGMTSGPTAGDTPRAMVETAPLLVGFDGSEPSRHALDFALREAALRGAPLAVLVVAALRYESVNPYEPGTIDVGLIPPIPEDGPAEIQPILREARAVLAEAGADGTVEWSLGDPVTELLRAA